MGGTLCATPGNAGDAGSGRSRMGGSTPPPVLVPDGRHRRWDHPIEPGRHAGRGSNAPRGVQRADPRPSIRYQFTHTIPQRSCPMKRIALMYLGTAAIGAAAMVLLGGGA